jgi:hypothetical protein
MAMKNVGLVVVAVAAAALGLSAACGSDGGPTPACSGGAMAVGGSGGGAGQESPTGGTGHGGSHGTRAIGGHCKLHTECADGLCLSEEQTGWGSGYCSRLCNSVVPCPDGTECVAAGPLGMICLQQCDPAAADCLSAQRCVDGVCVGGCSTAEDCPDMGNCEPDYLTCFCTSNAECPTLGNCEPDGFCYRPELCDNGFDDEPDGLRDCEDVEDCGAACNAQYAAACGAAIAAEQGNVGDTADGSLLFAATCTGHEGAKETIYTYAPSAADALVHVWLDSATDQGLYLRATCADDSVAAELGCRDAVGGGQTENLLYQAAGLEPLYLFVDGNVTFAEPDPAGPFTLGVREVTIAAEQEPNGTRPQANVVGPGRVVSANVGPAGDDDWFSVAVPDGATLWAAVLDSGLDTCAYGTIDSEIQLLAPDGTTELAYHDDNGTFDYCSSAKAAGLPAGTYYVRVSAAVKAAPETTFAYQLVIEAQ